MRVSFKIKALALENQLNVETIRKLLDYAVHQTCPVCLARGTIKKPLVLDHKKDKNGNGNFRGLVCQDCSKIINFLEYLVKRRPEVSLKTIMGEIEKRIA
jgi:hypothetical protein